MYRPNRLTVVLNFHLSCLSITVIYLGLYLGLMHNIVMTTIQRLILAYVFVGE